MMITLKDNSTLEVPENYTAKELAEQLNLKGPEQALAINVNGKDYDLDYPLKEGDQVLFWSFDDPEGKETFWHTSAHVLAQAVLRIWPDAKPTIGPPIENGFYYDFANLQISDADFDRIEKEMKAIISENYSSEREEFATKEEALKYFADNKYKCEMINNFDDQDKLSGYRQGDFFDLCRGPHLPKLGKIKAIKLLKTSGAYWLGDQKNEMLTRIYGISFPNKKKLQEHLTFLEEARKRDHRAIGAKLDLFSLQEEAPGMPFIHPNGMMIWNALTDFMRESLINAGYLELKTPMLMMRQLWEQSGHWKNYHELMFTSETKDNLYVIKPMNCPGCMIYYGTHIHSYRELPLKIAEIGINHRNEHSGAISGLFRVRAFHMDDAHIFMKPEDIQGEIINVLNFADMVYKTFGLEYHLELSTRPESHTIGTDEEWEHATSGLKGALEAWGKDYKINEGDGAFYGPKIDMHIRDAINRTWQCGTVQLDMALPRKFNLEYTAEDGTRKRPVMVHRAIFGSMERFLGIIIEHFAGKFPLWMSHHHVRIIAVADRHVPYADEVAARIRSEGFKCDVDSSHESVSKKVRNAQLHQINYILTIGDKEVENKTINLRTRDNVVHGEMKLEPLMEALIPERKKRALTSPFAKK